MPEIDSEIDQEPDQGGQFPPLAPTGLTATAGDTTTSLAWAAGSPGSASYNVYRQAAGGGYALAGSTSALSFPDMGLTDGIQYAYYVTAIGTNNMESQPSNIVSATPTQAVPLAPASPAAASAFATVGGVQNTPVINLSWQAPPSGNVPTGYNVYRGTAAGAESAAPIASNVQGLTYQDQAAAPGTLYFYILKAIDGAGAGPASTEVSAKTACLAPVMNAASAGDTTATLSWQASTGATGGYNVKQGSSAGGPFAQVANTTALTYTVTGLTDGTAYFFEVTAND